MIPRPHRHGSDPFVAIEVKRLLQQLNEDQKALHETLRLAHLRQGVHLSRPLAMPPGGMGRPSGSCGDRRGEVPEGVRTFVAMSLP
jgi:hypothetical protein